MSKKVLDAAITKMGKAVEHTRDEMLHIRTGKASPGLLDGVKVDYYGNPTPLRQIANVSAPEARLLMVQPYDKSSIGAIEKAILASELGLTPQNDGNFIRLPIPMLTAERREELVKVVRRFAEDGRVSVRNARREAKDEIKELEKDSNLSEDEAHRMMDEVQKHTDEHIAEIDRLLKVREQEIRED